MKEFKKLFAKCVEQNKYVGKHVRFMALDHSCLGLAENFNNNNDNNTILQRNF